MAGVSTHVLDVALGGPAVGVPVRLEHCDGTVIASATTDSDGRAPDLSAGALPVGAYRLVFGTAAYFGDRPALYPEVVVAFSLADPQQHYHLPLLLSPFAYSTYRGS